MIKGRILLLGGNFSPESTGIGKYNGEMIDWLAAQGHQCTVVTTYPYYPQWKIQAPYQNKIPLYKKEVKRTVNGVPINVYRCRHYIPAVPCGSKRIMSDISFFCSAFSMVSLLLLRKKYDYVITVAPPFQLGLLGYLYGKIKGSKFIYHIQDLQIDAASGLGMIRSKFLLQMMFRFERFIIRKADIVSTISGGMVKKIKAKVDRHITLFPNWADTKSFYPLPDRNSLKLQFNFAESDKIVLYSGAIGEKQGLQALLHTAKALSHRNEIKFIICGSGPYKQNLIELGQEMRLHNLIFMPLQPPEVFNRFLNMADVHLVLQKASANDLLMPSKLTTILSVGGLALVTAERGTSLHSVIANHNMGMLIDPDNQVALTAAIVSAVDHPHLASTLNAREFAEENLATDKVIATFFKEVFNTKKTKPVQILIGKAQKVKVILN